MKRLFSTVSAAILLAAPAGAQTASEMNRARAVHERAIFIDTHVDIPLDFATEAYDFGKPGPPGQQVHIPTMIQGGFDAPFLIVYVGQGERTTAGYAAALSDAFNKFGSIHRTAQQYPDQVEIARTAADVRRISAAGK